MKKLLISISLIFLSLNINAAISQSGITDLKQLNGKQITELISGNTLTGYISDGQFQGDIIVTYEENGSLEMFFVPKNKIYYGKWKVAYLASGGEGNCTKAVNVPSYTCYYWFTGIKNGWKYAFVKRKGEIIFQFHKVESANNQKADAEKERKKEDLIKTQEKHAKDAGYSSNAIMQAEINKKANAERYKKIKADAERQIKKKADAERERKKKAADAERERKKKSDEIKKQARINSKNNPGFRDLKPGMPYDDYIAICPGVRCYGIDNIKFSKQTSRESGEILISKIELDMGPITSDGLFRDIVNDLIESDSNVYRKMKRTFDTKYALDFEFSERDRQLFNEKEKRELLVAYSNGQVVLKINRRKKENSYSEDLWLYIEYRDVESGKLFLKRNRPVEANLSDF